MKTLKALAAFFLMGSMANASITYVPIENIYSPKGFDTNDNSQVIVEGFLPNLCYKAPKAKVKIIGKKAKIEVKAIYEDNGQICPEMIVPFTEVVDLGVLNRGMYKVVVNEKHDPFMKQSKLFVSESTSNAVDSFFYAKVEYVEQKFGDRTVKLKGYNPSDCMELDRIDVVHNGVDTYSVLPKMKQVSEFCPRKMVPFSYEMEVPRNLKRERVLLHVRVLDGKSVNAIYNNRL